jgi:hypothetical protein
MNLRYIILPLALLASACATVAPVTSTPANVAAPAMSIAAISDAYIRLTLEAGTHEAEYVDAYYGPPALQDVAKANPRSLAQLIAEARALTAAIDAALPSLRTESDRRRAVALRGMLVAADTRLQMLQGRKFSFNDEAQGQFATVPDLKPLAHYDAILANLETLIPGDGPLAARVDAFNERYVIPKDRLQPVFDAAIAECKRRTAQYIRLPAGETFVMEFVTGKPWSGYNYYKGNYKSLIQINTDLPIRISRAVDLGCHEGYPGHHVLNLMVEERLARKNGWKEYEVNPLYSPTSVLSEGSANYGIDLAFPAAERLAFERDILYPIAGLNPNSAQAFWEMQQMTEALSGVSRWCGYAGAGARVNAEISVAFARPRGTIGEVYRPLSQLCDQLWLGQGFGPRLYRTRKSRYGRAVASDGENIGRTHRASGPATLAKMFAEPGSEFVFG